MLQDATTYLPLLGDLTKEYLNILKGLLDRGVNIGVFTSSYADELYDPFIPFTTQDP